VQLTCCKFADVVATGAARVFATITNETTVFFFADLSVAGFRDTKPANGEIVAIPVFIYNSSEFYGRHKARNSVLKFRWHSPFVLHGSKSQCRFCNLRNPMTLLV
jgi:hypothetical protein